MRWSGGRRSSNIEDRRGMSRPLLGGGIGTLVIVLLGWYFGVDPSFLIDMTQQTSAPAATAGKQPTAEELQNDPRADMVAVVVGDTEDVWSAIFASQGQKYVDPTLVLYSGTTRSACGLGQSAMGPFYCPLDQKVYLDLSFFDELRARFSAPGDFAEAYVVAHEIGHHVQNLLGISAETQRLQQNMSKTEANALSVRVELQADCFAGVWGNRANKARSIIEDGDVAEALNAASAIGDDRLQKQTQGRIVPESFTHGTSEQRQHWFRAGLESGDPGQCDTFSASSL